jgi:gluconate 2-dehydrogenase gamma chain
MKTHHPARRDFLLQTSAIVGAAWMSAQWPAVVAAAQHAHAAANSETPPKFEVLTPEQARQVQAVASQIIPTDDLPGAREAGVVYFIDRALKTFASDSLQTYREGLAHLNQLTAIKYPGMRSFADATPEQQEIVMTELVAEPPKAESHRTIGPGDSDDFFQTIRVHTVFGFLADPSAGGNREYAGWKVVERDPAHTFSPPFGYYDKDYPGWQASSPETGKK